MARQNKKDRALELMSHAMLQTGMFSQGAVDLVLTCQVNENQITSALAQARIDLNPPPAQIKDQYVLGFAFDKEFKHVLLVWKNRPRWQAGKLNGVGGKIEPGEAVRAAMVREFQEETGICTNLSEFDDQSETAPVWHYVGCRTRPALYDNQDWSFVLHTFVTILPLEAMKTAQDHVTDEEVIAIPLNLEILKSRGVTGLAWTVEAAKCAFQEGFVMEAKDVPTFEETE